MVEAGWRGQTAVEWGNMEAAGEEWVLERRPCFSDPSMPTAASRAWCTESPRVCEGSSKGGCQGKGKRERMWAQHWGRHWEQHVNKISSPGQGLAQCEGKGTENNSNNIERWEEKARWSQDQLIHSTDVCTDSHPYSLARRVAMAGWTDSNSQFELVEGNRSLTPVRASTHSCLL